MIDDKITIPMRPCKMVKNCNNCEHSIHIRKINEFDRVSPQDMVCNCIAEKIVSQISYNNNKDLDCNLWKPIKTKNINKFW